MSGFEDNFFKVSEPLANDMGLYDGFLAAGLVNAAVFFLSCAAIAGIYGAVQPLSAGDPH